MKTEAFSIKIAAMKSGLTPFVIRAWERRYNAVEPIRTPSNQRRYTPANIERLTKLRQAVDAGFRIGDIANMDDGELSNLVESSMGSRREMIPMQSAKEDRADISGSSAINSESGEDHLFDGIRDTDDFLNRAFIMIQEMNERGLEGLLSRASISMTQPAFLEHVILPLARRVGDQWHSGEIRISQEHMATWVIKSVLTGLLRAQRPHASSPVMIVTTPAGQRHEIGALAVGITGTHCGWNTMYLGPDLPAEEIAAMALRKQADLVALSLVYPFDDPLLPDEMRRLKHLLPVHVPVVVGGAASKSYDRALEVLGIISLNSLGDFRRYLSQFRSQLNRSDRINNVHLRQLKKI